MKCFLCSVNVRYLRAICNKIFRKLEISCKQHFGQIVSEMICNDVDASLDSRGEGRAVVGITRRGGCHPPDNFRLAKNGEDSLVVV